LPRLRRSAIKRWASGAGSNGKASATTGFSFLEPWYQGLDHPIEASLGVPLGEQVEAEHALVLVHQPQPFPRRHRREWALATAGKAGARSVRHSCFCPHYGRALRKGVQDRQVISGARRWSRVRRFLAEPTDVRVVVVATLDRRGGGRVAASPSWADLGRRCAVSRDARRDCPHDERQDGWKECVAKHAAVSRPVDDCQERDEEGDGANQRDDAGPAGKDSTAQALAVRRPSGKRQSPLRRPGKVRPKQWSSPCSPRDSHWHPGNSQRRA
jgi:hypothetical protein